MVHGCCCVLDLQISCWQTCRWRLHLKWQQLHQEFYKSISSSLPMDLGFVASYPFPIVSYISIPTVYVCVRSVLDNKWLWRRIPGWILALNFYSLKLSQSPQRRLQSCASVLKGQKPLLDHWTDRVEEAYFKRLDSSGASHWFWNCRIVLPGYMMKVPLDFSSVRT